MRRLRDVITPGRRADDDRIRVLFVNAKRQPPLGADTWVHMEIIRELDRDLIDVHAACFLGSADGPTPTFERLCLVPDVSIRSVNLGREMTGESVISKLLAVASLGPAVWSLVRLAWYVWRQRIDVIHCADRPRDAAASVLVGRLTRTPSVVHVHVGYDPDWMGRLLQWAIRSADALIAISEFVAGTLYAGGHPPESVHLVLNGIDFERWEPGEGRAATRRELDILDDAPVVLTACRLFRAKGVSELIGAISEVSRSLPDVHLLVAGREMEGGYLAELKQMIQTLGLDDRVKLLGRRDDMMQLMAAADVFAMPSQQEPFGLVYAEAMAMGLPVVALDNGGTPEVVRHGIDGLLSAAGDATALASNLAELLSDPERRVRLGANGRRRVDEQLRSSRMATDAAGVFSRLRRVDATALGDKHRQGESSVTVPST